MGDYLRSRNLYCKFPFYTEAIFDREMVSKLFIVYSKIDFFSFSKDNSGEDAVWAFFKKIISFTDLAFPKQTTWAGWFPHLRPAVAIA